MIKKELLNSAAIEITLNRLACELKENHGDFKDSVLIGIQPRGLKVMERLKADLKKFGVEDIQTGTLDVTFFRDDFRRRESPIQANQTHIDIILENKKVVFIDDVLYTGRSIRSALDAVQSFGRPAEIELLVLIDRRFSRHLPIQPDYTGKQVDSLDSQKVLVEWKEEHGEDAVFLIKPKNE
jgi:pyrimidine operon attenuation protein/uracil phosphoribosyltransferase